MSDIDRQIAQLRQRFNEATDTNLPVGKLGKTTGELTEASRPGYIYVREYAGNGNFNLPQLLLNALPDGTHIYAGLDVEIGMRRGERAVVSKDHKGILAAGGNPSPAPSPYVNAQAISTLLVKPTEPPSMYLQVLGGSWVIDGITYTAPTTDGSTDAPHVNLTSIEAGLASGKHCYATVYLLADFSGYEVFASTGKSTLLPIDDTDIDECHTLKTAGSVALRAVEVSKGQTEFDNNNVYLPPAKDLRTPFALSSNVATLTTTNNTATIIASIPVAEGSAVTFVFEFVGVKDDYSAACGTTISGTARRAVGGSTTIVGSPTVTTWEDSAGSPAGSLTTATGALEPKVAGVAAETWNWRVTWRLTRIA